MNALSAHMIHVNLNTIFYTHVQNNPTKTIYIKYYMKTHTRTHTHARTPARTHARTRAHARTHARSHIHTHSDCSRNWVLILVGAEILWEEQGFQSGFKRWLSHYSYRTNWPPPLHPPPPPHTPSCWCTSQLWPQNSSETQRIVVVVAVCLFWSLSSSSLWAEGQ